MYHIGDRKESELCEVHFALLGKTRTGLSEEVQVDGFFAESIAGKDPVTPS